MGILNNHSHILSREDVSSLLLKPNHPISNNIDWLKVLWQKLTALRKLLAIICKKLGQHEREYLALESFTLISQTDSRLN